MASTCSCSSRCSSSEICFYTESIGNFLMKPGNGIESGPIHSLTRAHRHPCVLEVTRILVMPFSTARLASFRNQATRFRLVVHLSVSYQDLLEDVHVLVGNGHAVDLPDLVADVQRGLPVDHSAVHDTRHQTAAVVTHLQCDPLCNTAQRRPSRLRASPARQRTGSQFNHLTCIYVYTKTIYVSKKTMMYLKMSEFSTGNNFLVQYVQQSNENSL